MIDRYPRSHLVPDESGGLGRRTCMWLALMREGASGTTHFRKRMGRYAPCRAASEVLWFLRSIYCTRTLAAFVDLAHLHGQRVPADARDLELGA